MYYGGTSLRCITMKTILTVEDEPHIRNALQFSLERAGYDVRGAPNAKDALGVLTYFLPDLVLLDLVLPDMDGLELLQH
jgi:DNA-binding response OmpR family regulator